MKKILIIVIFMMSFNIYPQKTKLTIGEVEIEIGKNITNIMKETPPHISVKKDSMYLVFMMKDVHYGTVHYDNKGNVDLIEKFWTLRDWSLNAESKKEVTPYDLFQSIYGAISNNVDDKNNLIGAKISIKEVKEPDSIYYFIIIEKGGWSLHIRNYIDNSVEVYESIKKL